jgi:hypothetical protein
MVRIRTIAAHEVVQATFPRPTTERDELGLAVGKAIDSALARFSHEFSRRLRPTVVAMNRFAAEVLDDELAETGVQLAPETRPTVLAQIAGVLKAFRASPAFSLARPRSRLLLIDESVGVYAQPDFWDPGARRFYEMKSYRAVPSRPDVALQLSLFQLAFPGFDAVLLCFDRHATPIETIVAPVAPLEGPEIDRVLDLAFRVGTENGQERVLEYVDNPVIRRSRTGHGTPRRSGPA